MCGGREEVGGGWGQGVAAGGQPVGRFDPVPIGTFDVVETVTEEAGGSRAGRKLHGTSEPQVEAAADACRSQEMAVESVHRPSTRNLKQTKLCFGQTRP